MCGILCEICLCETGTVVVNDKEVINKINNRGPNYHNSLSFSTNEATVHFYSSVLWMQGASLSEQPLQSQDGVLVYNGDIFDPTWSLKESDTNSIFEGLQTNVGDKQGVIKFIKSLKGPFSIIFFDRISDEIYFTRDRIGRNSLLFHLNEKSIVIASVLSRKYKCIEIPAESIHSINLRNKHITSYSWTDDNSNGSSIEEWLCGIGAKQNIPDAISISYDINKELIDKHNTIDFIQTTATHTKSKFETMEKLLENKQISYHLENLLQLLKASIKIRVQTQPMKCKLCLKDRNCDHCTVGVLFSGGIDCTLLAFLADKYVPPNLPIDLFNVAFKKDTSTYDVPDRLTGKQSLRELEMLCPDRKWVFKEVNVTQSELHQCQNQFIADLVYPRRTILDESLGSALWFAARGDIDDVSTSRLLLVGSGADELFGGYLRHRNAYKRKGWTGLDEELHLDWSRISVRNLARDNRVICDHGKQPRLPYLDEEFTSYVLGLEPWFRCFPSDELPLGLGDKLMLRLMAYKAGMRDVAILPKRAMQFGSRIANKKEKGDDVSRNFLLLDCDR